MARDLPNRPEREDDQRYNRSESGEVGLPERKDDQRFRWSEACVVGLPGLESGTSSLSVIEGSPLCGAAFSQVAADRQGRSNAF